MKTDTPSSDQTNGQSTTITQPSYTTGFVTSRDGATIGYRQLGHGPGVVLLHGAMESAQSHMELARRLADSFTVYLPDRRGRGLSGSYRADPDYSIQKEVDDIEALLARTGAHHVFGVSAGGDILLQAALTLPAIHKVAVYEPAFMLDAAGPRATLTRFDREMAQGHVAAALVTGMLGAQMGPPIFSAMPRWLLKRFTTMGMAQEDKTAKPGEVTMRELAPTLHNDFTIVTELSGRQDRFRAVQNEVLLLGGSKSPAYLKTALTTLEKILPHVAGRVEFPGLDHGGSSDLSSTNRNGKPELVAEELLRFFV